MEPQGVFSSDSAAGTSRRALLRGLTVLPVAASLKASPWDGALTSTSRHYGDEPARLERTKNGRSLSRFRYQQAERYLRTLEAGFFSERRLARSTLHMAGFVSQQALCSYLLDVGFADEWNARQIKQDVVKALAYANTCGFGHACPDMARLAVILSPFWKWGYHYDPWEEQPDHGGFTPDQITPLVHALVDHVHAVTGHPRPKGWRLHRRERQS